MNLSKRVVLFGALGLLALLVASGTGGWWLQAHHARTQAADGHRAAIDTSDDATKALYWYDPMHPERHFDAPGRSPFMDMALVPKYTDAGGATVVQIDPGMAANLGIRTAPVVRGVLGASMHAVGRVEVDERSIRRVTVRASGWIEALHVRADGEHVQRHELLAQVYSPAFDTAQREFLLAVNSGETTLIDAARAQLDALGVDAGQLAALERNRQPIRHIDVYSPIEGYVMGLMKREGDAVERDAVLFELASHDPVWIIADIPEALAGSVEVGQSIEARVSAHPGRVFEGRVDYLYPALDTATRTRRARIELPNHDDALHPGMYADVALAGTAGSDVLLVPSEAVIRTGRRDVAIVVERAGGYRPVAVRIGEERDGSVAILEGLQAGDQVVVSGQFLLDSEASLRGAYDRMADTNESVKATP